MDHPLVWRRGETPEPVVLLRAWWKAAGAGLARVAVVCGVRDGLLEVTVSDPTWEKVLSGHRGEIVARLRSEPGGSGIRDLVIRREDRKLAALPREPSPVPPPEAPREIREAALKIPDSDLALRWVEAVGRLLARRRPEDRG